MIMRALLISFATIAFAAIAHAQVMVIGKGLAAECYEAAKYNRSAKQGISTCDRALNSGGSMTLSNRAATYTNRGVLKMRSGKYDSALSDFSVSKRLRSDVGETWLNEGAALIYKDQFAAALPILNKAIELETSQLHAAYYNRAIAREQSGDVQGAYQDFKKAQELLPSWPLVQKQLSRFTVIKG